MIRAQRAEEIRPVAQHTSFTQLLEMQPCNIPTPQSSFLTEGETMAVGI